MSETTPKPKKKTSLLVTFIHTHIGGAMTSLVNFLNALDLEKYEVDVLFYHIRQEGRFGIKEGINILPQAKAHNKFDIKNVASKVLSPSYMAAKVKETFYKKVLHNRPKAAQIISRQGYRYSKKLSKTYDIAIAYEFGWCMYYTANYVNARKKLLWLHVEYETAGMDFRLDKDVFARFDKMVFVSENVLDNFVEKHPELKEKATFFPNLMSTEFVQNRGVEEVPPVFENDPKLLKMITVARIRFDHKAQDRGVRVLKRLKDEGLAENLRWIIIGKGPDEALLRDMIAKEGLTSQIACLGVKTNPIPYLKEADVFFLPSIFEGKPMVVTEGFMMGLVPVVTRYASADEQIAHGVYGLVADNNEDALYETLKQLVLTPELLHTLKENVKNTDFGNTAEIAKFDELVTTLSS